MRHETQFETYRGRFAPSPTGPLHFGSLISALGSYLQAKAQGGQWLVRIEDLDPPREVHGAADDILRTLEAYHLHWDGPVVYQSRRSEAYDNALAQLADDGRSYPCACSRKEIAEALAQHGGQIYPGTCRDGLAPGRGPRSTRLRTADTTIQFDDRLQGHIARRLASSVGDFIVRRADGFYAYHLAVVVDDGEQAISEVVRGIDLLEATPPQIYLQGLLGLPQPAYLHLPVAVNAQGQKLSKQTYAAPIDRQRAGPTLTKALHFLGHPPPRELAGAPVEELLAWATRHWSLDQLPRQTQIVVDEN